MAKHMREHHKVTNTLNIQRQDEFKCRKCNFDTSVKSQLTKHIRERHKKIFYFWKQGRCNRMENCAYLHPAPPRCRLQLQCHYWPNCKFSHDDNNMCVNGVNCQTINCNFQHPSYKRPCNLQNMCEDQYCQFEHFQGVNSQGHFLGGRQEMSPFSMAEFPPIGKPVKDVWR